MCCIECLVAWGVFEGTVLTAAKLRACGVGDTQTTAFFSEWSFGNGPGTCSPLNRAQALSWRTLTGTGKSPAREYANNYTLQKASGPIQCANSLPGTFLFNSLHTTCVLKILFQKCYGIRLWRNLFAVPHRLCMKLSNFCSFLQYRAMSALPFQLKPVEYLLCANVYYYSGLFSLQQFNCPCCLEAFLQICLPQGCLLQTGLFCPRDNPKFNYGILNVYKVTHIVFSSESVFSLYSDFQISG